MLIVWEMVACPRLSSKANSITRLAELADPRYAVNPSSSETWWPSTSLHSHGKHLLVTAIDGVPLWVMVVHCQPQAAQKNMEKSRAHRRQWWAIVFLNFIFVLLSPQGRIQGGEEIGADPRGGGDWGDRSPKTYESNLIHDNFLQFGKQHSRY